MHAQVLSICVQALPTKYSIYDKLPDWSVHSPKSSNEPASSGPNPFAAAAMGQPTGHAFLGMQMQSLPSICIRIHAPVSADSRRGSAELAATPPAQQICDMPTVSCRPLSFTRQLSRQLSSSELLPSWSQSSSQCATDYAYNFHRQSSADFAAQLQALDDAVFDAEFAASQS